MGFDFKTIPGERGRSAGGRGRFRQTKRMPQTICLVTALAVCFGLAVADPDVDPGNLWAIPTVPLWITVFTGHLWRRAPGSPDDLSILVLRNRVRRVLWRAALVLVFAAFALLWTASFWHWRASIADGAWNYPAADADAEHYAYFAGLWWWPLPAAAFLVLVQPLLVRLAPASIRGATRREKAMKAAVGPADFARAVLAGYDLDHGVTGHPPALAGFRTGKRADSGRPVRPDRALAIDADAAADDGSSWFQAEAFDGWWRNAALRWDGAALIATDATGAEATLPVAGPFPDSGEYGATRSRRTKPRTVAELVWYEERYHAGFQLTTSQKIWCTGVLFLDTRGVRVAQMPGLGFTADRIGQVAQAAGLPFTPYNLGQIPRDSVYAPSRRLFPGHRRAITVKAR